MTAALYVQLGKPNAIIARKIILCCARAPIEISQGPDQIKEKTSPLLSSYSETAQRVDVCPQQGMIRVLSKAELLQVPEMAEKW